MATIQRIRQKIIEKDYYLSSHAEDEMLDNRLERRDIEKKLIKDIRGTRYRIDGPAKDGRHMHVICRFKEDGSLVIITVYVLRE